MTTSPCSPVGFGFSDSNDGVTDDFADSQIDGWVVALPLSFEGFSMAPFFVYSDLQDNAENSVLAGLTPANIAIAADSVESAWWAGSSFELSMLDPFILKADINYGSIDGDNDTADREGWLFDIALQYTGFDFMNLELAYAYTSGKDADGQEDGRMPVLSDSWALGTFWFGGGLITGDDIGSTNANMGFHALALSATGIQSFVEGPDPRCSHRVRLGYQRRRRHRCPEHRWSDLGSLPDGRRQHARDRLQLLLQDLRRTDPVQRHRLHQPGMLMRTTGAPSTTTKTLGSSRLV